MSRTVAYLLVALCCADAALGISAGPVNTDLLDRTMGRIAEMMRQSASPSAHPRTASVPRTQHHMTCEEMLDADGDPDMSVIESEYDTAGECTAIWGYDIWMEYDCPVTDEDNDYNLPFGSCCENTGQCNDGLVCSWGDRTCTYPCEGPEDASGICGARNTSCYGTGAEEECFTCDAETECDPNRAFCRTCKSYVGLVNETYLEAAGCGNIDDDVYGEGQDYHTLCANRPKCTDPYLSLLQHVIEEDCIDEWICPELDEENSLQILDLACSYNDNAQTCFEAITTMDVRSCVGWVGAGCCIFGYYDGLINQTELNLESRAVVEFFDMMIAECGLQREACALCDPRWTFTCASGGCVPMDVVCDGVEQCIAGEDEADCTCTTGQVRCRTDDCIMAEKTCDGTNDCDDGFDESAFYCPSCELMGGLDCDGTCIPAENLCDGTDDCPNGSDELPSNCIMNDDDDDDGTSEDLVEPSSSAGSSTSSTGTGGSSTGTGGSSTGTGGGDDDDEDTSGAASVAGSALTLLTTALTVSAFV